MIFLPYRKEIRIRILLKTPLGGVPPPLVFDFGRFVDWKRSSEEKRGEVGRFFEVAGKAWIRARFLAESRQFSASMQKSWVRRGVWSGSVGVSWAAPGHLGRLLGGF